MAIFRSNKAFLMMAQGWRNRAARGLEGNEKMAATKKCHQL
jgi:hypothetical protein